MAYDVIGLNTLGLWTGLAWNTDDDEDFPVYLEDYGRNLAQIGSANSFEFKPENYRRADQE